MKTSILLLLALVNFAYSEVVDTSSSKRIFSKDYMIYSRIEVVSDSSELKGILIFEFVKNPLQGIYYIDNETYTCDIYFISSLDDFKHNREMYIYNTAYIPYGDYYSHNKEIMGTKKHTEYMKYRTIYQKFEFLGRSVDSDFERGNNLYYLNTSIFKGDSINYWYYNSEDTIFTIFNVSIPGALLKYDMIYYNKDDEIIGDFKDYIMKNGIILKNKIAIIPTDRTHYFAVIPENEMLENGFKKSSWIPKNLHRY